MNLLNNHFQKALVFIIVLLIIISNMRTYSVVGNYQTVSSWAIKANENHELQKISPKKSYLIFAAHAYALGFDLVILTVFAVGVVLATGLTMPNDKPLNYFNKNYAKHDFSKFDN